ncbi:MAG TPA: hypothetical protein VGQ62_09785, partial [Chloroflexota bacterium]|nr:hypothetical protein [Chloroflexota bacterium]
MLAALPATAQVSGLAPENLRCPGVPAPPLPGPDWKVEPVWEWRVVTQVDSTRGSSDGPYAVAVDHECNSYLTDSEHFQITKLSKEGNVVANWPLPGARSDSESS